MGLELTRYLVGAVQANVILTARTMSTARASAVQDLEAAGAVVMVAEVDVTDLDQMRDLVVRASERFGRIDGVVHAAGVPGGGLIFLKEREEAERVMAPKILGARVLEQVFADRDLDFMVLCSSVTAIRGDAGQVDYCAANSFLDAFARDLTGEPTLP